MAEFLADIGARRPESERFGTLWGHGGADPGIRAHVPHREADGVTVIVMTNRMVVEELTPILERLFLEGGRLASLRESNGSQLGALRLAVRESGRMAP